jgi:hypothetical protein
MIKCVDKDNLCYFLFEQMCLLSISVAGRINSKWTLANKYSYILSKDYQIIEPWDCNHSVIGNIILSGLLI